MIRIEEHKEKESTLIVGTSVVGSKERMNVPNEKEKGGVKDVDPKRIHIEFPEVLLITTLTTSPN